MRKCMRSPHRLRGQSLVQDDYVYYPGYQVYYSSNRRQYIYQDGRSWVSRPAPPRVSVDVLFASPSVRLDFHDSPAIHHARLSGSIRNIGRHHRERLTAIGKIVRTETCKVTKPQCR